MIDKSLLLAISEIRDKGTPKPDGPTRSISCCTCSTVLNRGSHLGQSYPWETRTGTVWKRTMHHHPALTPRCKIAVPRPGYRRPILFESLSVASRLTFRSKKVSALVMMQHPGNCLGNQLRTRRLKTEYNDCTFKGLSCLPLAKSD